MQHRKIRCRPSDVVPILWPLPLSLSLYLSLSPSLSPGHAHTHTHTTTPRHQRKTIVEDHASTIFRRCCYRGGTTTKTTPTTIDDSRLPATPCEEELGQVGGVRDLFFYHKQHQLQQQQQQQQRQQQQRDKQQRQRQETRQASRTTKTTTPLQVLSSGSSSESDSSPFGTAEDRAMAIFSNTSAKSSKRTTPRGSGNLFLVSEIA